jgi:hypothetical protein
MIDFFFIFTLNLRDWKHLLLSSLFGQKEYLQTIKYRPIAQGKLDSVINSTLFTAKVEVCMQNPTNARF